MNYLRCSNPTHALPCVFLAKSVNAVWVGVLDWGLYSAASVSAFEFYAYTCYVLYMSPLVHSPCGLRISSLYLLLCCHPPVIKFDDMFLARKQVSGKTTRPIRFKFTNKVSFGMATDWVGFDYCMAICFAMVASSHHWQFVSSSYKQVSWKTTGPILLKFIKQCVVWDGNWLW